MLKLVEGENAKNMALKLHPTMERMKMMKKWKTSLAGILTFFLTVIVTTTAFADVRVFKPAEVIVLSGEPLGDEEVEINLDNRVKELSEEEYEKFYKKTVRAEGKRSANISDTQTLGRFENREYSFNMNSWGGANHNGFTRLFVIQIIEHSQWVEKAVAEHTLLETIMAERGQIYMMDVEEFPKYQSSLGLVPEVPYILPH